MLVAIIRVNGPTSDQQGPVLNTVMLGFLCQDGGGEDDDDEKKREDIEGEEDDDEDY